MKPCDCCELEYPESELRYYGVARLCDGCRDNAISMDETDEFISKERDKERR